MFKFFRFVAHGHLVKDDAVGPHIDRRSHPGVIGHLWRLVILGPHELFHVGHLTRLVNNMTQAEVANFSNRTLFSVFKLTFILLIDQDVIYFYVGVDDASLVHVPYALEDILCPNGHLVVLDGLVFSKDLTAKIG